MRISDWSSDVCSSDLEPVEMTLVLHQGGARQVVELVDRPRRQPGLHGLQQREILGQRDWYLRFAQRIEEAREHGESCGPGRRRSSRWPKQRSEEHTSELQQLMRNTYGVFLLKKKK